jgi:DNA-binding protein YbaB
MDADDLLGDWEHRAEQQTALTVELSERLRQVKASATSDDGAVTVTVDHAGGLADLRLDSAAFRNSPDELASLIVSTSQRAQATVSERAAELARDIYGSDSPTATLIADAYAEQFPDQPPDGEDDNR